MEKPKTDEGDDNRFAWRPEDVVILHPGDPGYPKNLPPLPPEDDSTEPLTAPPGDNLNP